MSGSESKHEKPVVGTGAPGPQGDLPDLDIVLTAVDSSNVSASQSGPDGGVQPLQACAPDFVLPWNQGKEWGFGESTSLYDCGSTGQRNGEPVADCFGLITYGGPRSGAILAVADGVSWGEPARRAARCAVLNALRHLHRAMCRLDTEQTEASTPLTSRVVFHEMVAAVHEAQKLILRQMGTLTTLVLTVVLPQAVTCPHYKRHLPKKARALHHAPCNGSWAAMTLTVGDSAAWVWRGRERSVDELTAAAHEGEIRDVRFTAGALGYAQGDEPDLTNMTMSVTLLEQGDLVFLGSDGVADNFQPEQLKLARAAPYASEVQQSEDPDLPPCLSPAQLQSGHLELLGQAVRAASTGSPRAHTLGLSSKAEQSPGPSSPRHATPPLSAQALVKSLLAHVTQVTEPLRQATAEKNLAAERRMAKPSASAHNLNTDAARMAQASRSAAMPPGKLDHATVVAYQVGWACCATPK